MDKGKDDDVPAPEDETLSAAEIELTALAIDAWQTNLGDYQKTDCANATKAAIDFLRMSRALLAGGSPRMAFSALNQARASCEKAGLLLETYEGLEAELLRERLVDIETEMRLAWERLEPMLE